MEVCVQWSNTVVIIFNIISISSRSSSNSVAVVVAVALVVVVVIPWSPGRGW